MKWCVSALILALAVIGTPPLQAEQYDLAAILELAERNSAEIALVRSDLDSAEADRLAAISTALPKASAQAGYSRTLEKSESMFGAAAFDNGYSAGITLQQPLFRFEVLYSIQGSRYLTSLTENQYDATVHGVLTAVKKAFYQVLLLDEVRRVAEEAEANALANLETVRTRFETGAASEFDLLQAETNYQATIPDRFGAERDYRLALNNLKTAVGLPLEEEVTLSGDLGGYPEIPREVSFEEAVQRRPDYRLLLWEKELRQLDVKARRSVLYPTLDAQLSYGYSAASDDFRLENEDDSVTLGLQLTVPLSTGGNTIAQVRKAQAELEKTRTRIGQTEDSIRIELANTRLRMREARQRIEAARKGADTARRTYEIAETRLDAGLATQVELQGVRVALSRAEVTYFSAIFDYLAAYFDWELAIGQVSREGV